MEKKDPRFLNELPPANNIEEYLGVYAENLKNALSQVSTKELKRAEDCILKAIETGKRVYVAGNGGSAAIGDHLCCDWMKGTYVQGKPPLKVQSLPANIALLTALANDFSFDKCFSAQIDMQGEKGDIAVLISSSGNSPNVIEALHSAKKIGMTVIGLSGFTGGKLKELSDISLHAPVNNYGLAEDCHQALMHVITHSLNRKRDQ